MELYNTILEFKKHGDAPKIAERAGKKPDTVNKILRGDRKPQAWFIFHSINYLLQQNRFPADIKSQVKRELKKDDKIYSV